METQFSKVIQENKCKHALEKLNSSMGLNCHAWDTLGKPILPTIWGNTLCKAIKSTQQGLLTCASSHKEMTKEAKTSGKPVVRECHAGLLKAVLPVYCEGKYIGLLGGCGATPKGRAVNEEYLCELGPKIGVSMEELLAQVVSVPEVDREALKEKIEGLIRDCGGSRT